MSLEYKKTIGIVIPHFKAPDKLQTTISHLRNQGDLQIEIYVRDNSVDNIYFTKAVNEGLRNFIYANKYEFTLVLNQDAKLYEGCLRELVFTLNQYPLAGICAPISLNSKKTINWSGSADAFPWGRHLSINPMQLPKNPFETYWINGACMLFRNAMLRDIGLLDENMKFICSDADISFTARARGWKCLAVPNAFIEHELGGSASTNNSSLNQIKLSDQLYFARKWLSGDLYRMLAFEGSKLTPQFIESQIQLTTQILTNGSNAHLDKF